MSAIGGDAETPPAASANTMLLHQLLHPLFAHANALGTQCAPDARPTISSTMGHIHSANMHHQRFRAQVTAPGDLQATNKVLVVASHTYPSIRHCTRIGHTRRLRRIMAYFTSAPWQSTP
jgi:hypothetical protein